MTRFALKMATLKRALIADKGRRCLGDIGRNPGDAGPGLIEGGDSKLLVRSATGPSGRVNEPRSPARGR